MGSFAEHLFFLMRRTQRFMTYASIRVRSVRWHGQCYLRQWQTAGRPDPCRNHMPVISHAVGPLIMLIIECVGNLDTWSKVDTESAYYVNLGGNFNNSEVCSSLNNSEVEAIAIFPHDWFLCVNDGELGNNWNRSDYSPNNWSLLSQPKKRLTNSNRIIQGRAAKSALTSNFPTSF